MNGKNHAKASLHVFVSGVAITCCRPGGLAELVPGALDLSKKLAGQAPEILGPAGLALFAGWAVFGSLLPDIDSRESALGRYVCLPFGHRTWTHSIWAVILIALLCAYAPVPGIYGLLFGYVMHLFTDGFSHMGICLFYPFTRYRYLENGTWKSGSGGRGPKTAEHHRIKIYKTNKASPGHRFLTKDDRTGKPWLTDTAFCLVLQITCYGIWAYCAIRMILR